MVRFVPIAILLGALGCGSGSAGGSFNGVVRGQPMKPADAISSPARVSLGPISADVGGVVLTDVPGVCGRVTANSEPKNGKALVLFLADFNRQTLTATAPPRSTRRAATARPSPRAAPVTMATRPAKSRSMRSPGSLLVVGRLPVENPLDRLEAEPKKAERQADNSWRIESWLLLRQFVSDAVCG